MSVSTPSSVTSSPSAKTDASPKQAEPVDTLSKDERRKLNAKLREQTAPLRKKITQLEKKLVDIESKLAQIEHKLSDADIYAEENKDKLLILMTEQTELKQQHENTEEELLVTMESLEEMDRSE